MDKLEEKPLQIKTFLLSQPEIIPTALPKIKDGSSSGMLVLGFNEGLPSMQIDDLLQDQNGMIWFICNGNLYRYNGAFTEHFLLEGKANLMKITEDRQGLIWLCADQGYGLYVIDIKAGIQWHIDIQYSLFDIFQDHSGFYWIGSRIAGVFIIDWSKRTIKNFRKYAADNEKNTVEDIMEDRQQRIWLAGADGIGIINKTQKKIQFLTRS